MRLWKPLLFSTIVALVGCGGDPEPAPEGEGDTYNAQGENAEGEYAEGEYAEGEYAEGEYAEGEGEATSQPAEEVDLPALGAPAGVYGEGVDLDMATALADLDADIESYDGVPVRIDGTIQEVCTKKGCWMTVMDGDMSVRVRFQDYGFFVPRDAGGRNVIVQGTIRRETISEEVAKHYADESGDPEAAAAIEGDQEVLAFTATGVEILGSADRPEATKNTSGLGKAFGGRQPIGEPAGEIANSKAALAFLRTLKGPRTVEFTAYLVAKLSGQRWYVFGTGDADAPLASGYAVGADGQAVSY